MRKFTTIRYDGDTVGLKWEDGDGDAIDKHDWSCDEPPTPAFKAALAAFSSFVVSLIEAPAKWADGLEIRSLALSEEKKTGARGLVVTALRKVPKAKGRTLLLNSPYLAEPPEGYNGPMDGYLSSTILELIEDAEQHAEAYRNGERGEQTSLPLESENTKAVNERMASAEVASTRKPKGKKGKTSIPGVGDVVNPDSDVALDDAGLRQLLLSCDHDVPVDAVARWSSSERDAAQRYGMAQQRKLAGEKVDVPALPKAIKRDATLPLKADAWTSEPPPAIDEAGIHAVQDAARG